MNKVDKKQLPVIRLKKELADAKAELDEIKLGFSALQEVSAKELAAHQARYNKLCEVRAEKEQLTEKLDFANGLIDRMRDDFRQKELAGRVLAQSVTKLEKQLAEKPQPWWGWLFKG